MPRNSSKRLREFFQSVLDFNPGKPPVQKTPPCLVLKPPLTFFDRHLDESLALNKVVLAPSLLSDLASAVDVALKSVGRRLPSVEQCFPHSQNYAGFLDFEPAGDAKAIAQCYRHSIASSVEDISSMLLLHPNASSWVTSINFTTKSTSRTHEHYALYEDHALEFLAPYEHDADQKFTMVEEEAWKVLSDDERLLLREVKQRFPRIALWHFYFASPEAEHALKCMNSLTSMERLPSVAL
ncbi:hypothetical protein H0H92_005828, partial [Tricholoma furcatifolium]